MVQLSLPVGPTNVKADLTLPTLSTIRNWWRRLFDPAPLVKLQLRQVELNISGPEDGTAVFFMQVTNLSRRPVTIDRLVVAYWSWGNYPLPTIEPAVNGIRSVIPRRSIDALSMTIHLTAKIIRLIREAGVKAPNLLSAPRANLHIYGSLHLLESRTPVGWEFQVPFPGVYMPETL